MTPLLATLFKSRRVRSLGRAAALRKEIRDRGPVPERMVALGDALAGAGELLEAVQTLTEANRLRRDPSVERRLVRLRRKAFGQLDRSAPPAWRPSVSGDEPEPRREVTAPDLTLGTLRHAILRHGCLLVRGLLPSPHVTGLRHAIDRAFDARETALSRRGTAGTAVWYDPLEKVPKDASRSWVRAGQGLLAADSPRGFFELLETVGALGLDRLIAGYLGERPCLSVEKTVLRRADASLHASTWHQDGAFLGTGIRTLDVWFALSRCGRDAPGLDLIPIRLDRVLPTGEAGTYFEWTVSPETIARELPGVTSWRPEFEAGDVLFFDHFLIHRTAAERDMPGVRYAVESWYFAPSVYPRTSTPLVV